jgi:TIR domain
VVTHLRVLAHDANFELWDDHRIAAGEAWLPEIEAAIQDCDVALLLISADFLTSNFILNQEIPKILQRRASDGVRVIPVILRPCAWNKVPWLKGIQARPKDGKPLSSLSESRDEEALAALAEEISDLALQEEECPSVFLTYKSKEQPTIDQLATPTTWRTVFRDWLETDFIRCAEDFQGFFAAHHDPAQSKRWQSKGGEIVTDRVIRKRPYYETFWGYRAALCIAPECVEKWRPLTICAIERHFGEARWLQVVREYSFSKGPTARPPIVESVRHTARAADVLRMLDHEHRRVSEVAWALISESDTLQNSDGGWTEFRGTNEPSSLWATAYVYRFLAGLVNSPASGVLPERQQFMEKATRLLQRTEAFLANSWRKQKWTFGSDMPWQEGCAALLPEVAEFLTDRAVVRDAFSALRSLLSPAGRLEDRAISRAEGARPEIVQALNIAFALHTADHALSEADERYRRLLLWITQNLDIAQLKTYEVDFAALVMDLDAPASVKAAKSME